MARIKTDLLVFLLLLPALISGQSYVSGVWKADNGNGTYKNPVLHADYSDPDVCAVGNDFYLTASSFNCAPGLPILHSNDLVNWEIIGHALKTLEPDDFYSKPQHGRGVWAPCIRFHQGEFYIYWGDPDFGIYMTKTSDTGGDWEKPVLVKAGKGLIDPTPLWDEDGKVYLANGWAGSRSGINSVLTVSEMNAEGTKVISNPVVVFDGNDGVNHTVEGPKFYKRNGYYYILAPAGGVESGWQLALRSKNVYGPYEPKIVMKQGKTNINGPHQGAWVETAAGESWFLNFQEKAMYGRVLHLNPMKWVNDWPVIGVDKDGDGCGEPVSVYKKPDIGKTYLVETPAESDEFDNGKIGLQWQWHANYKDYYGMPLSSGCMRIYANYLSENFVNLWEVPNLFLQKFPSEEFTATMKATFTAKENGDRAGIIVMGWNYSYLSLVKNGGKVMLEQVVCTDAEQKNPETHKTLGEFDFDKIYRVGSYNYLKDIYFRVKVEKGGKCTFSYSLDNRKFSVAGDTFVARQGKWIGAKVGVFAVKPYNSGNRGWVDVDWFRVGNP
ncbi:MAG TPA: glycoside hydrolase 43 family protein [Paludibacter sp.]|nr:glycoside hydrolase 43 family protein [Paludibacter sp.]